VTGRLLLFHTRHPGPSWGWIVVGVARRRHRARGDLP
jgi:hypothetical protein